MNKNRKSGIKISLDGSNIWIKSNSIRENKREGVEVSFYGILGTIEISKSKILNNGNYGITRLQRNSFSGTGLGGDHLKISSGNTIAGNDNGQISAVTLIK